MNPYLIILTILFLSSGLISQVKYKCGSISQTIINEKVVQFKENKFDFNSGAVTIPVVVHIFHHDDYPNSNLSIDKIQTQIRVLNEDFFESGFQFKIATSNHPTGPRGLDLECGDLAITWTDLNEGTVTSPFTSAVYRPTLISSPTNSLAEGRFNYVWDLHPQQVVQWPWNEYLNIYVLPDISNGLFINDIAGVSPVLGYTSINSLPQTSGPVVHHRAFGTFKYGNLNETDNLFPDRNLGHNLSHEIGHWLGLLHTWGLNEGSCSYADGIQDTPPQSFASSTADCSQRIECGNIFIPNNIMDYVSDDCTSGFSSNQQSLMYSNLINNSLRKPLVNREDSKIWDCSPVNDDIFCAIDIEYEDYDRLESEYYSLSNATASTFNFPEDGCTNAQNNRDVWFRFSRPHNGGLDITAEVIGGSTNDLVMEVYYIPEGFYPIRLKCDDDGGGNLMPLISFDLDELKEAYNYYIRIVDYNDRFDGHVRIMISNACRNYYDISTISTDDLSIYKTQNSINSSALISNSEMHDFKYVNFRSAQVNLISGFTVEKGVLFEANIDPCKIINAGASTDRIRPYDK